MTQGNSSAIVQPAATRTRRPSETFRAAGGTVAYWDTDSVLVAALPHGGLVPSPGGSEGMPDGREAVRALSFAEVQANQWRIDELLEVPYRLSRMCAASSSPSMSRSPTAHAAP